MCGDGEIWKKQQKEVEELRKLQKGSAGERKMGAYSHTRELLGGGQRDCVSDSKLMQCEVGGNIRMSLAKTPM